MTTQKSIPVYLNGNQIGVMRQLETIMDSTHGWYFISHLPRGEGRQSKTRPLHLAKVALRRKFKGVTFGDELELAREFHALVRATQVLNLLPDMRSLLSEILVDIDAANAKYPDDTCATHDYCDANEIMQEAFLKCVGCMPDLEDDGDVALWNGAWDAAVKNGFSRKWAT